MVGWFISTLEARIESLIDRELIILPSSLQGSNELIFQAWSEVAAGGRGAGIDTNAILTGCDSLSA